MKKILMTFLLMASINFNAQELRSKLEASYKSFSEAVKTKDAHKLKATLSSYAYMNIKNGMLSNGAKFPDEFFAGADEMQTDLGKLKFIKVVNKGPTAYCIYWGKDSYEETSLYIFTFLEENNEWKFNMLKEESSEELTKKINEGNFDFLTEKKYQPDGIMPETPKEITPGDFKAVLDISSSGFEVEVSVNGALQKKLNEGSYSGVIIGGIKKGANKMEIKIISKIKDSMFPVKVTVRALIKDEEKEVFSFKDKNPQGIITKEFIVQ